MSLLVDRAELLQRRRIARGTLAPLAEGLRRELEPLVIGPHDVPREKALLSRVGGRCERDGGLLAYDPFDARHRCPRCGREHTGEPHDRYRLVWHQLWLAERTVHAALLGALLDDARCVTAAGDLLDAWAVEYLRYPAADSVLGPSRPFFSTYLESIWLLQLAIAVDLLEEGVATDAVRALGARVRERIIAPSAALIASYDEGMSNRQVWNGAALLAAGRLIGDDAMTERAFAGPSGLLAHLERSLLADGSWYEGENYHLFAHRGLVYAVLLAERAGLTIPATLRERFREGFAAPFRTLLPDLTYPSRRDSQYAVSVRQPRFAESCELGLRFGNDERLASMLARLYDPAVPHGETGRASSTADAERNLPATGLTRADLSWRSLLLARESLPPLVPTPLASDLLPAQGFGILRREEGAVHVALDYGHPGGGHGHPDRLNLLLADHDVRWFDDPGTGSYVDPSLHWYRSTLAHHAPLVDGRSQPRVHGRLLGFEDDGRMGWIGAEAGLAPGLRVRRFVTVGADWLLDALEWNGDAAHEVALPLHGIELTDAFDRPLPRYPAPIEGGEALEDGFSYLRETARLDAGGATSLRARSRRADGRMLHGWIACAADTTWWSARAPDVPGRPGEAPLVLARRTAPRGRLVMAWSWREAIAGVVIEGDLATMVRQDGREERVALVRSASVAALDEPDTGLAEDAPGGTRHALPADLALGASHYRRSEVSWTEAGEPRANVRVGVVDDELSVDVQVPVSHRIFVPMDADNPLDNEPAAINGDGVQLYVEAAGRRAGWLLVPRAGTDEVSVRPVEGWGSGLALRTRWRATARGWAVQARIGLPAGAAEVALDVVVNETAPGRARRRGQLVLSGADGEFVYLRGDRHERARLLRFTIPDA